MTPLGTALTAVASNTVALFGIACNILNVIILHRHGPHNSTGALLKSLAVADLLYLTTSPAPSLTSYLTMWGGDSALSSTVDAYIFCYGLLLNSMFLVGSTTHIVIIALERVLAVYFPLDIARCVNPRRMSIATVFAHVIWYPILFPLFFITEVKWVLSKELNRTVAIPAHSRLYENNLQTFEWFHKYVVLTIIGPGFSATVLACCLAIGVKLYLIGMKRLKLAPVRGGDKPRHQLVNLRAAKMLVVICVIYLLTSLPSSLLLLIQNTSINFRVDEIMLHATNLTWCINCSSNFVVYVLMSNKFNKSFRYLCCFRQPIFTNGR